MGRIYLLKITGIIALLFFFSIACNNSSNSNSDQKTVAGDDKGAFPIKDFLFDDDRPFPQCHASTVVHLKNGSFLSAWFGGTEEKDDDVGIWMTRGKPGDWETPFEVAKIREEPHWNPVLFQSPEGRIFLFFKVGKEIPEWETWIKTSDDQGKTWSEAYEMIPGDKGGRGPVRNKPIVLSDGTWIAGASNEKGRWNVFFDRSEDQGKTWKATPYVDIDRDQMKGKGVIQPTLWESAPGEVHALLRSSEGVLYRTDSEDYGKTWSKAIPTDLPNPNSGVDLTKLSDGTLVLAYNPDDDNWGSRGVFGLAVSTDNGVSWPKHYIIENEGEDDEFSYPGIISFGDTIAVTYTWQRETIAFWEAPEEWLLKNVAEVDR